MNDSDSEFTSIGKRVQEVRQRLFERLSCIACLTRLAIVVLPLR